MADEERRRVPPPLPEADAYIRRLDPDYISLVKQVEAIDNAVLELQKSNHRQERYLVGGWSEDGAKWITGVRERVEDMSKRFGWMASGLWALALLVAGEIIARAFGLKP